ncbi:hypothetical protein CYY_001256 [Polysphondylium violaceum]|uniref:Leucine-rich repeat-containing protein n=1 Tax=Polysphondylium violaceum TaxID=133409 RepID=A0A8J4Q291_9MYCE|nr:hypothetical protein CYY_001256 [Polysphondylium violaceum]
MNNLHIINKIIKSVFEQHYNPDGGGLDNPRNKWIINLALISHQWFDVVTLQFTKIVIHNNSSIKTLSLITKHLEQRQSPYSILQQPITEIRFESMDQQRYIDKISSNFINTQFTSKILKSLYNQPKLESLLLIDSDSILADLDKNSDNSIISNSIKKLVYSTSLQNSNLTQYANLIKRLPGLECIYLYCEGGFTGIDDLIELFARGTSIQDYQINFGGLPGPKRLIGQLIDSPNAHMVKKLQTSGISITVGDAIDIFSKLKNLESFNVPINYYNLEFTRKEPFTTLSTTIGQHKCIKELFLYEHHNPTGDIVDEKIKWCVDAHLRAALADIFVSKTTIELLSIDELPSQVVSSPDLFDNLKQQDNLQVVKISNGSLDNTGIDFLSKTLMVNNSIYFVSLQNNNLSNERALAQVLSTSTSIKELDISGNSFIGTEILLSIIKNNKLNSLTCNSDNFSAEAKSLYNNVINNPNTLSNLTHHVCFNKNDSYLRFFQ